MEAEHRRNEIQEQFRAVLKKMQEDGVKVPTRRSQRLNELWIGVLLVDVHASDLKL